MPPCCGGELRVLSFIFNLSSFSLLVHYGLIADQTPVDSCWARSTILALASIQRLYLTPCPPIKRISFAFWASMERIINDRRTIRHQVNSVKALRNKQMYACSTMRKSILSVCVCVCLMCVSRWMLCVLLLPLLVAVVRLYWIASIWSLVSKHNFPFYRFIDNAHIGWQSKCIRFIHSVNVYYGHLFIHCDIPLKWIFPPTYQKLHHTKIQCDRMIERGRSERWESTQRVSCLCVCVCISNIDRYWETLSVKQMKWEWGTWAAVIERNNSIYRRLINMNRCWCIEFIEFKLAERF